MLSMILNTRNYVKDGCMNEWTERYIDVPMAKQMDMKGKWIDKWLSG